MQNIQWKHVFGHLITMTPRPSMRRKQVRPDDMPGTAIRTRIMGVQISVQRLGVQKQLLLLVQFAQASSVMESMLGEKGAADDLVLLFDRHPQPARGSLVNFEVGNDLPDRGAEHLRADAFATFEGGDPEVDDLRDTVRMTGGGPCRCCGGLLMVPQSKRLDEDAPVGRGGERRGDDGVWHDA